MICTPFSRSLANQLLSHLDHPFAQSTVGDGVPPQRRYSQVSGTCLPLFYSSLFPASSTLGSFFYHPSVFLSVYICWWHILWLCFPEIYLIFILEGHFCWGSSYFHSIVFCFFAYLSPGWGASCHSLMFLLAAFKRFSPSLVSGFSMTCGGVSFFYACCLRFANWCYLPIPENSQSLFFQLSLLPIMPHPSFWVCNSVYIKLTFYVFYFSYLLLYMQNSCDLLWFIPERFFS